jgi:Flp pilus assembly pilin Flp
MKNDLGAHFFKNQSGTTAIEYGLIGALTVPKALTISTK